MKGIHGYVPQLSSSSALGQSSNPSQTEFFGMQEPSPQVKSVAGHGAKPTERHRQKTKILLINPRVSHSAVQPPRF